jgi:uncharacterized membrane protein
MATLTLDAQARQRPVDDEIKDQTARIQSVDFVRGVAMILMAIDHVRVYSGLPAGGPSYGIFFTRWVTHVVAPAFVFLAGTAAFLHARRLPHTGALSWFLFTRGVWLVLLELTVIRVMWTFNFDFAHYMLAGVIWMIGCCMMLMAVLIHLPVRTVGILGLAIIALHNVTDLLGLQQSFGESGPPWFLTLLYFGGGFQLGDGGPPLLVLFVIVPWIGVMMAGFAFGEIMAMTPERRRSLCLRLGFAATLLFVAIRALNIYGDPRPWTASGRLPALLSFLNTTKYPASLSFLLMTLGPMLLLLGWSERWRGRIVDMIATFGRVPMLYYLLHIPVLHLAAIVVSMIREGRMNPWLFGNHPMAPPPVPEGYVWSLPLLYLIFAICIVVLYVPCRWFANVRAKRSSWWLSYL